MKTKYNELMLCLAVRLIAVQWLGLAAWILSKINEKTCDDWALWDDAQNVMERSGKIEQIRDTLLKMLTEYVTSRKGIYQYVRGPLAVLLSRAKERIEDIKIEKAIERQEKRAEYIEITGSNTCPMRGFQVSFRCRKTRKTHIVYGDTARRVMRLYA